MSNFLTAAACGVDSWAGVAVGVLVVPTTNALFGWIKLDDGFAGRRPVILLLGAGPWLVAAETFIVRSVVVVLARGS